MGKKKALKNQSYEKNLKKRNVKTKNKLLKILAVEATNKSFLYGQKTQHGFKKLNTRSNFVVGIFNRNENKNKNLFDAYSSLLCISHSKKSPPENKEIFIFYVCTITANEECRAITSLKS